MMVKIYGRKTRTSKAELLQEMDEIEHGERFVTNAEQAMSHFARSHYKVALFSDYHKPDIVYINRGME